MTVLVRLVYRCLAVLLSGLALPTRSSAPENAEILILRAPDDAPDVIPFPAPPHKIRRRQLLAV